MGFDTERDLLTLNCVGGTAPYSFSNDNLLQGNGVGNMLAL